MSDTFYYTYLWVGYNLLDAVTTHLGLLRGYGELNGLLSYQLDHGGPLQLMIVKLSLAAVWGIAVLRLSRYWPKTIIAMRLGNILVFGAVFWNGLRLLGGV